MTNKLSTFKTRLEKIGIDVTFVANYPWIYFDTINGKEVTGTFHANHGWTAFFLQMDSSYKFSDRREVFKKVREVMKDPIDKPFPHNILRRNKEPQYYYVWQNHKGEVLFHLDDNKIKETPIEYKCIGKIKLENEE